MDEEECFQNVSWKTWCVRAVFVAENKSMSLANVLKFLQAGELADIDEVAGCRKVFVEQASAMTLREAWYCVHNVELL